MSSVKVLSKFVAFLTGATFLFVILLSVQKPTVFPLKAPHYKIAPERRTFLQDNSPTGFLFLKTHKTATETMLEILRKYRDRTNLTNEVTSYPEPYVGGYPGRFRSDLALINHENHGNETPRIKADVLMDHSRFNKIEMMSVMKSNVKYITILRNPFHAFESSFNFFYGQFRHVVGSFRDAPCFGQPFMQITGKVGVNFSEYLTLVEYAVNDSLPWYFRSINSQAYDLGLDPMNNDMDYIFKQKEELDKTFDLVLITDYLLESLILLKKELRMTWQDVIPSKKNRGRYKSHIYTGEEERVVRKLNNQDLILYDHFNKTLWNKIEQYGKQRMERDVERLKRLILKKKTRKKKKKTAAKVSSKGRISTKKNGVEILMNRIWKRRGESQNVSTETTRRIAEYMINNSGWCPL